MRIRPLALALALAALSLTGCGQGAPTPGNSFAATPTPNGEAAKSGPEVAEDAARELEKAGAATARGTVTEGGQQMTVDLHLEGDSLTGTVLTGGHAVELIGTGDTLYAKTDAGYWTSVGVPRALAERAGGRWAIVPPALAAPLTPVSLTGFADELRDPPGNVTIQDAVHVDTVHAEGLADRDGQPVVVLTESDGTTIDVAATGSPYPLLRTGPDEGSTPLTFSAFGEERPPAVPSSAVALDAPISSP